MLRAGLGRARPRRSLRLDDCKMSISGEHYRQHHLAAVSCQVSGSNGRPHLSSDRSAAPLAQSMPCVRDPTCELVSGSSTDNQEARAGGGRL